MAEFLDAHDCELTLPVFAAERPAATHTACLAGLQALRTRVGGVLSQAAQTPTSATATPIHGGSLTCLESLLLAFDAVTESEETLRAESAHPNTLLSLELTRVRTGAQARVEAEVARRVADYQQTDAARVRQDEHARTGALAAAGAAEVAERHAVQLRSLTDAHTDALQRARAGREADSAAAADIVARLTSERDAALAREGSLRRVLDAEELGRRDAAQRAAGAERELLQRLHDAQEAQTAAETTATLSLERWKVDAASELEGRVAACAREERRLRDDRAAWAGDAEAGRAALARLPGLERRAAALEGELEAALAALAAARQAARQSQTEGEAAAAAATSAAARASDAEKRLARCEAERAGAEGALEAARSAAGHAREAAVRESSTLAEALSAARAALRARDASLEEALDAAAKREAAAASLAASSLTRASASWAAQEDALTARLWAAEAAAEEAAGRAEEGAEQAAGLRRLLELTRLCATPATAPPAGIVLLGEAGPRGEAVGEGEGVDYSLSPGGGVGGGARGSLEGAMSAAAAAVASVSAGTPRPWGGSQGRAAGPEHPTAHTAATYTYSSEGRQPVTPREVVLGGSQRPPLQTMPRPVPEEGGHTAEGESTAVAAASQSSGSYHLTYSEASPPPSMATPLSTHNPLPPPSSSAREAGYVGTHVHTASLSASSPFERGEGGDAAGVVRGGDKVAPATVTPLSTEVGSYLAASSDRDPQATELHMQVHAHAGGISIEDDGVGYEVDDYF